MSLWLNKFQIGADRDNMLTVGAMTTNYILAPTEEKQKGRNVKGKLNKVKLDKMTENITAICRYMKRDTLDALQSAISNYGNLIYFKPLDEGFNNIETRTPKSVNQVQSIPTSRRFITINSIVLASAPLGTNYGGTMDEETGLITFATPIPSVEDVIINYNYKGWFGDVSIQNITLYERMEIEYFEMTFILEGK